MQAHSRQHAKRQQEKRRRFENRYKRASRGDKLKMLIGQQRADRAYGPWAQR